MRILAVILFFSIACKAQIITIGTLNRNSGAVLPTLPDSVPYVIVDDYVLGADGYEHTYTGAWSSNSSSPTWYGNTQHCCGPTNGTIVMRFNGTKIQWFTERATHLGIAAVSIDGGAETNVDLYNATQAQQIKVWDSGTLSQAEHTVTIRVTGTKNASSSNTYIVHDYLKVYNNLPVDPEPPDPSDPANLFVATAANGGSNTNPCTEAQPCLTLGYTVTLAGSGDLVQMGPGTFVETGYITPGLGVSIRGSGIDVTILKGASNLWDDWDDYSWEFDESLIRFQSNSTQDGSQYIKDLTIDGTGTAALDGVGPVHPSALNDRGLYSAIWISNRNNVTVDGIKVKKCFLDAIYIENTQSTAIKNSFFVDNAYGQSGFATGNIMWGGSVGNTGLVISGNDINEGWGNGLKAFGPPPTKGTVTFDIFGNHVSVTPTGQWSGGSAPNIGLENWGVKMVNCLLHDNYFDATVSLVDNEQDDDAITTIRVYNNTMDMRARSNGLGYCVELSVSYAEVDHNYMVGGRYATIANYQAVSYPTLSPWYGYWNIHHNSVIAAVGVYPSPFVRSDEAIHQTNIYHNTIEVQYSGTGTQFFNMVGVMVANQASADVNIKNNVVWGTLPANGNKVWWVGGTGQTITNAVVSYNCFYQFDQNALTGITYSNNITTNPQMNKTGTRPDPFYRITASGNLDNTGTNVGYGTDMGAWSNP